MRITQELDYAYRIIVFFTNNNNVLTSAPNISEAMNIPLRFTLKILRKLNLAGLTTAQRGATGGYLLNRDISEISLYDVMLAISGPVELNTCLSIENICTLHVQNTCGVRAVFDEVQRDIIDRLSGTTFQDIKNSGSSEFVKCNICFNG